MSRRGSKGKGKGKEHRIDNGSDSGCGWATFSLKSMPTSVLGVGRGARVVAFTPSAFKKMRLRVDDAVVIRGQDQHKLLVCGAKPLQSSVLKEASLMGAASCIFESLGAVEGSHISASPLRSARNQVNILRASAVELRFNLEGFSGARKALLEHAAICSSRSCYLTEGDTLLVPFEGSSYPATVVSLMPLPDAQNGARTSNLDENFERLNISADEPLESRLRRFYAKHNPSKMEEVSALSIKYAGREQEVFDKLHQKYGVGEDDLEERAQISSESSSKSESPICVWLVDSDSQVRLQVPPLKVSSSQVGQGTSWDSVGGLDKEIAELKSIIQLSLSQPDAFERLGVRPPRGVLLHGPPGTGKTTVARAAAASGVAHVVDVYAPDISSSLVGESEAALRRLFEQASKNAPSIMIFDEIDMICPRRDSAATEMDRRIVATLLSLMDGAGDMSMSRVAIIACTNRPEALDPALRRPGRLDREVEIGVPDSAGREEILRVILKDIPHSLTPGNIAAAAQSAHGFVGADLSLAVKEAALLSFRHCQSSLETKASAPSLTRANLEAGLSLVSPSGLRELAVEVPRVFWDDIGGQSEVKQRLKEVAEWPLKYPEAFTRMGISPPTGVLLYGPPGCSKTLMARALATESGMNFIAVKGPELLSKWVGESERALQSLFRRARSAAPTIVFFDEVDALAGARGDGGGGSTATERVLSQLLTELDGLESSRDVITVAATNRPDMIDPALLRPGRLDRLVYVRPPDRPSRAHILEIGLRGMPRGPDIDINLLSAATEGFSGAEMVAVCREAALDAIEEDPAAQCVSRRHLEAAVNRITPQITQEMCNFYESWGGEGGSPVADK